MLRFYITEILILFKYIKILKYHWNGKSENHNDAEQERPIHIIHKNNILLLHHDSEKNQHTRFDENIKKMNPAVEFARWMKNEPWNANQIVPYCLFSKSLNIPFVYWNKSDQLYSQKRIHHPIEKFFLKAEKIFFDRGICSLLKVLFNI